MRDLFRPWTCRGGFGPFGLLLQMLLVAAVVGLAAAGLARLLK